MEVAETRADQRRLIAAHVNPARSTCLSRGPRGMDTVQNQRSPDEQPQGAGGGTVLRDAGENRGRVRRRQKRPVDLVIRTIGLANSLTVPAWPGCRTNSSSLEPQGSARLPVAATHLPHAKSAPSTIPNSYEYTYLINRLGAQELSKPSLRANRVPYEVGGGGRVWICWMLRASNARRREPP